jgi:hypothetical protein
MVPLDLYDGVFAGCARCRWGRPKLSAQQQAEIRKMITKGDKTAADAARLFKVHPATISRLLARTPASRRLKYAK